MVDSGKLTIHESLRLMERGECSSEEIVSGLIATIKARDDAIGAYVSLDEAGAIESARAADKARREGRRGRLLGVPIAVKDILNVRGQPCTCGSKILQGYMSPYDATVIARLRAEGAVFVGRTNMDEFAMGSSTENSAIKITHNPWRTGCVPGGSSGGSAAAVGGDLAVAALGTDTGGSIRQPSAFCSCVGLKPSYGRVSRYGVTAFASSLDQVGPMTKDVRDAAIMLGVMAGRDEMDSTTPDIPVPDYTGALNAGMEGLTLGLPREYFVKGMDPEVERLVRAAVAQCEKLGARVVDISLPHTEYAMATYYIIATAEASANLARFDGVRYGFRAAACTDPTDMYGRTRAAGFGPEVKRRIILGTYVLSSGYHDAYYLTAQKVRTLIRKDFNEAFDKCHAILSPVTPTPAYPLGAKINDPLQMYLCDIFTVPANMAGICGMSVPCGFTKDGLPVGLQVLGPAFKEENVFHVGHAYEQAI